MKHKCDYLLKGDKVRIKSKSWYNIYKDRKGDFLVKGVLRRWFYRKMAKYCGREAVVVYANYRECRIDIDNQEFLWSIDMFEDFYFDEQIARGSFVMCTQSDRPLDPMNWRLYTYGGRSRCYHDPRIIGMIAKHIVPFEKFNPYKMEETMQCDILK